MIDVIYNMLDEELIKLFNSKISDKKFSEPSRNSTTRNYYNRLEFDLEENIKDKLELLLFSKYNKKYTLKKGGVWINKVSTESNKDDDFHFDNSDLSIVTYLNDDFEGGQFEYIISENENIKINPKKGVETAGGDAKLMVAAETLKPMSGFSITLFKLTIMAYAVGGVNATPSTVMLNVLVDPLKVSVSILRY